LKPKCILINPWIYDFAAVNLWSKPLGLLLTGTYMSRFDIELHLIDCTDVYDKYKKYGTGKYPRHIVEKPDIVKSIPRHFARYGISIEEFSTVLKGLLPFDFVFITSIMCYWYLGIIKTIDIVRSLSPGIPIILGGIYATLFPEHASSKTGADFVFGGPISRDIISVLKDHGIALKERYDQEYFHYSGLYKKHAFAPILTSTGCPYNCSYCASSILSSGFSQRDPSDVINDIMLFYKTGVRDFAFYDDALLVNAGTHLKVILKEVIKKTSDIRFHCPNGIHARYIDEELAYLMKKAGFTTLRLGLETVNEQRQRETGGKISTDEFISSIKTLKHYGFTKENIGVYLMYGLPGQDLQEVFEGVEFLKKLGVRIHLTEFSPVPGTPFWNELIHKGIISENTDPLLTNNTVFSYLFSNYNPQEIERLKLDVKKWNGNL
jgi:radical SAM superfamily enzyme YgiQ (UPF0313 family)